MKDKKAQIWISAVLYILIAVVAIVIILQVGLPVLDKMKDKTTYSRSTETMSNIDQQIQDVASEGQGSQRVIPIEIRQGNIFLEEGKIRWSMDTKTQVIEPKTRIDIGNLKVYSNIDVYTEEDTEDPNNQEYIIGNSLIEARFDKAGKTSSYNTEDVIKNIELKETGDIIGGVSFKIGECGYIGEGWTEMKPSGENADLGTASVILHMRDATGAGCVETYDYDIELIIESETDYIKTKIHNLEIS